MIKRFAHYDYKDIDVLDRLFDAISLPRKKDVLKKFYAYGEMKAFLIEGRKGIISAFFVFVAIKNLLYVTLHTIDLFKIHRVYACKKRDNLKFATSFTF